MLDSTQQEAGTLLPSHEVEIRTTRDSGPGGQHRNKTESCVVARHIPTGLEVKAAGSRSQHRNKALALEVLAARVGERRGAAKAASRAALRKGQVGSGQRADKVRTYRERDDQVTDHASGAKARLRDVLSGNLERLWG